jgi:xanthine dehydrogenase accessory factor
MRDLLAELAALLEQNRDCVWCSVVQTRGSTPQKAGATMLVLPDGSQRGTLGGGCIEAEVKQRALRVLAQGGAQPQILTFCLDDNYGWDDGLICGGRMSILADPVRTGELRKPAEAYYRRYRELVEAGRGCTEAVIVDEKAGAAAGSRFLFDACGRLAAQSNGEPLPAVAQRFLVPVQQRPRPAVHHGVAYLPILPRITLLIVGGGHVGQAVARLAGEVDFDIWVLDDRPAYANRDRFPTAKRHLVGEIGPTLQQLAGGLDQETYCLIVTRGHAHDEEALYHLAEAPAGYVGMIGSKRKIKLIFEDVIARGIPPAALERVHAPLGLDIGSQTVMEIAVSIVAELIARRNLGTTRVEPRRRIQPGTTPGGEKVIPVGKEGRDLDNH